MTVLKKFSDGLVLLSKCDEETRIECRPKIESAHHLDMLLHFVNGLPILQCKALQSDIVSQKDHAQEKL